MYVKAIEKVNKFTRPIHTISRNYGSSYVFSDTSTLFFVNEEGCAITCKHVAALLGNADQINNHYQSFINERNKLSKNNRYKSQLKQLEKKYNLGQKTICQIKNTFMDCVDSFRRFDIEFHPQHEIDLAIIKFDGFKNIMYKSHAVFLKDSNQIKQGKNLCRFGYPFPEFSNYKYDENADDIEWTQDGRIDSPSFPIDGLATRHLLDSNNKVFGIEMSTPGLKGQSGGPLFDDSGVVYGLQFATNHLHLGFDIENKEVISNHKTKKVTNQPFLNVGHCVHVDIIKDFLKDKKVKYYEE